MSNGEKLLDAVRSVTARLTKENQQLRQSLTDIVKH